MPKRTHMNILSQTAYTIIQQVHNDILPGPGSQGILLAETDCAVTYQHTGSRTVTCSHRSLSIQAASTASEYLFSAKLQVVRPVHEINQWT